MVDMRITSGNAIARLNNNEGPVAELPVFTRPAGNRQVVLTARPSGTPEARDFAVRVGAIGQPAEGQFLVRNLYLSADPVQRGWAANPALTPIDAPFRALAVGVVVESRDSGVAEGDVVYGYFGWQDYAIATRETLLSHIGAPRVPISAYAGVLGMPGVTAWLALGNLAPPRAGDAVLVSTAAGAVGSVVGQLVRAAGGEAFGLTSNASKIRRCVDRFGYTQAYNYREGDLAETLSAARPAGFDIYFDNTGGAILDSAIRAMAKNGRIVQCGTAATSSWNPPPTGLRNEREILLRTLTWSGFVIFDHVARFGEAINALTDLMLAGQLAYDEDIDRGIDQAAGSLATVFAGTASGKKLIYIGED
ncbi:MAG: oxidoreductase zinc-binding protein [Sphingomonadales bacterium]|nr:oxidoreductase zinc-binding protein [Sphingomonadales bacterium]